MRRYCKNLDERQLLQRGNVFQHTMILLFILLLADGFLREEGVILAEGMWQNLLILWISFTLCFCEFIIREITPMGNAMGVFYTMIGAVGAFLLGHSLFHVFTGNEAFAVGSTLTHCGASIFEGGMMVLIFLVFLGKKWYNHVKAAKGDED